MRFLIRFFSLLIIVLASGLVSPVLAQEINWMTWEEAQAKNAKEPRKFIVDVYTQWCGWCKKMDKATFEQPDISKYINQNYYAVKFDAETKEDINFNNRVFKYVKSGTTGYNELAVEITFGKLSYPTIVFLDETLNVIQPIPGYKDPASLDKIMKYFAEDYYKSMPWKKYEEMYLAKGGVLGDGMAPKQDK
jgi:thioredoxin-related protein